MVWAGGPGFTASTKGVTARFEIGAMPFTGS